MPCCSTGLNGVCGAPTMVEIESISLMGALVQRAAPEQRLACGRRGSPSRVESNARALLPPHWRLPHICALGE